MTPKNRGDMAAVAAKLADKYAETGDNPKAASRLHATIAHAAKNLTFFFHYSFHICQDVAAPPPPSPAPRAPPDRAARSRLGPDADARPRLPPSARATSRARLARQVSGFLGLSIFKCAPPTATDPRKSK